MWIKSQSGDLHETTGADVILTISEITLKRGSSKTVLAADLSAAQMNIAREEIEKAIVDKKSLVQL